MKFIIIQSLLGNVLAGGGLWNAPGLSKAGKSKSSEEAKKGYIRFLEMAENKSYPFGYNKKKNKEKSRYGYSGT